MKYGVMILLTISALSGAICFAQERPDFKDLKNRESYSLGYQFGQGLKTQGIDIDSDAYFSGLRDSLNGSKAALSKEEMQSAVLRLQKRVAANHQREIAAQVEKNVAEGKAFMEENKKKEGVVSLPSGLQYKVLVEGSGKTPSATDMVSVHYKGSLINGKEFDSSYERGIPTTFRTDSVIRGWMQALQLMKVGLEVAACDPPGAGLRQPRRRSNSARKHSRF